MNRTFHIRAEFRNGTYADVEVGAHSLPEARARYQSMYPDFAPFDWRGAVVFCEASTPVEERAHAPSPAGYKLRRRPSLIVRP